MDMWPSTLRHNAHARPDLAIQRFLAHDYNACCPWLQPYLSIAPPSHASSLASASALSDPRPDAVANALHARAAVVPRKSDSTARPPRTQGSTARLYMCFLAAGWPMRAIFVSLALGASDIPFCCPAVAICPVRSMPPSESQQHSRVIAAAAVVAVFAPLQCRCHSMTSNMPAAAYRRLAPPWARPGTNSSTPPFPPPSSSRPALSPVRTGKVVSSAHPRILGVCAAPLRRPLSISVSASAFARPITAASAVVASCSVRQSARRHGWSIRRHRARAGEPPTTNERSAELSGLLASSVQRCPTVSLSLSLSLLISISPSRSSSP
ncbi:hypothetical protein EVG20_g7768 [Dentipellis fragilis]|uniref:Uncharacterized protein n=1 Tax=Dentipellis fragilis TaxID=205917 RepID=A0A4Y9YBV6_9AGAM|nr:hypothetical protein EVG20_g7768 [Dentipellis fragilis]